MPGFFHKKYFDADPVSPSPTINRDLSRIITRCSGTQFEIIGEAAHNIESYHAKFAAAHPEVPWTVVYAMCNRVAHGYFKIDLEMIWKTIHTDLPELHAQIKRLLEQIKQ